MRRGKGWKWSILSIFLVAIIVFPLYFILIGGLQSTAEIFHKPPYLIPPNPTLAYYIEVFHTLLPYLKNSVALSFSVLLISLVVALPAAFVLAQFKLPFDRFINSFFALVQIMPFTAIIIPLFLIFVRLRLIQYQFFNAVMGITVFQIPFAVIVLRAYMLSLPKALIEAALVDGAGYVRILINIVLPLSGPGIASVSILTFLMAWGNFIVPLAFISEQSLQPMSLGLYRFVGQYGVQWNKFLAGCMIYSLPPVILALVAGRLIVAGLTAGAFKE